MLKIGAIIFDLDGTLIDSFEDIAASINVVLAELGKPQKDIDEVRRFVGHGINNMLKKALELDDESVKKYTDRFRDIYWGNCLSRTKLYPGVREGLEKLAEYKKAVATNKQGRFARKIVEGLGIGDCFDAVLGGDDFPAMKPDPRAVIETCRRLNVVPRDAMMVGDYSADVESALGAGAVACGVSYGIFTEEQLIKAGAIKVFGALTELPEFLKNFSGR